jgi:hypothetical protein
VAANRSNNSFVEELQGIHKRVATDLIMVEGADVDWVMSEFLPLITNKLWELHGLTPDGDLAGQPPASGPASPVGGSTNNPQGFGGSPLPSAPPEMAGMGAGMMGGGPNLGAAPPEEFRRQMSPGGQR